VKATLGANYVDNAIYFYFFWADADAFTATAALRGISVEYEC
jgi:hypothetical protein